MFSTKSPIKLYTWKSNKLNEIDPKVIIKDMNDKKIKDNYLVENNVKQLARLFSMSLPGNTVDLFYDQIADHLMSSIENDSFTYTDKEFISNHIRIAINLMLEKENKS